MPPAGRRRHPRSATASSSARRRPRSRPGVAEMIVVNDGSIRSRTRSGSWPSSRRRASGSSTRRTRGSAAARMAGVLATDAPYVQPLDSDDILAPGVLGRLAAMLDADPGPRRRLGIHRNLRRPQLRREDLGRLRSVADHLPERDPGRTVMHRRSSLLESGGWKGRGYEDWNLWMTARRKRLARRPDRRRLDLLPGPGHLAAARPGLRKLHRHRADMRRDQRALYRDRFANWRRSESRWA